MVSDLGRALDNALGDIDVEEQTDPTEQFIQQLWAIIPVRDGQPTDHETYPDFLKADMQAHIESIKGCMRSEIPVLKERGLDGIATELDGLVQSDTSDYDYWKYEEQGKFNWNRARPDIALIEQRLREERA